MFRRFREIEKRQSELEIKIKRATCKHHGYDVKIDYYRFGNRYGMCSNCGEVVADTYRGALKLRKKYYKSHIKDINELIKGIDEKEKDDN